METMSSQGQPPKSFTSKVRGWHVIIAFIVMLLGASQVFYKSLIKPVVQKLWPCNPPVSTDPIIIVIDQTGMDYVFIPVGTSQIDTDSALIKAKTALPDIEKLWEKSGLGTNQPRGPELDTTGYCPIRLLPKGVPKNYNIFPLHCPKYRRDTVK